MTTTYPVTGNAVPAYDAVGTLTLRTDEAGVAVQSSYDVVNRSTEQC